MPCEKAELTRQSANTSAWFFGKERLAWYEGESRTEIASTESIQAQLPNQPPQLFSCHPLRTGWRTVGIVLDPMKGSSVPHLGRDIILQLRFHGTTHQRN